MKNSINESIKCALGLVIAITLTFIVVMIIFMGCFSAKQGESRPVYDALYIGGTFFGGFATLTAAYIASRMFNDWKSEKKFELSSNHVEDLLINVLKLKDLNYEFSVYRNSGTENINIEKTKENYLKYIWCFRDTQQSLKDYILIIGKSDNLNKNSNLLGKAMELHEWMNSNYEKTILQGNKRLDAEVVFSTLNANSPLVFQLEEFVRNTAHPEIVEQLN